MTARKAAKPRRRKQPAPKPAASLDLSRITIAQASGAVIGFAALLSALWAVGLWFFRADLRHAQVTEHEPRIEVLEESDARYNSIWDESIKKRQEAIRKAEEFCRNDTDCVGQLH